MNNRFILLAALLISFFTLCTSCDLINNKPIEIDTILLEGIEINVPSTLELTEGDKAQVFQVYFKPKGAQVKKIKTSSSYPNVASVDYQLNYETGLKEATSANITITPLNVGTTEILIEIEEITATSSVNVNAKEVTPPEPPTPEEPVLTSDEYIEIYYYEADNTRRIIRLATKNLGASTSTEVGDYFSYGDRYKSYESGHILRPYEDAATMLLGNEWRTPSPLELKFIKACASDYTIDDVYGRLIKGENGKNAFMPAGGYKYGGELNELNVSMAYWGNEVSSNTDYASSWYSLATAFGETVVVGDILDTNSPRSQEMNIRPIKRPNAKLSAVEVSNITTNSATLSASVDLAEILESDIESAFFELSTKESESIEIPADYKNGVLTVNLTELQSGITYSVYAAIKTIADGYYYSEKTVFDTEIEEELEVDLGLSVIWAGWDLGATKSSELGDLFSWGETSSRGNNEDEYTYENNKYTKGHPYIFYTKYNDEDKKMVLEPEDDAATVLLGEEWHIPTFEEWSELVNNCDFSIVARNGIEGVLFTSKINGKTIFFTKQQENKYYWSSSLYIYNGWSREQLANNYRYAIFARIDDYPKVEQTSYSYRYSGFKVRAVKKK